MESAPAGRDVLLIEATPLAFNDAVPTVVPPFMKVTVPVGVVVIACEATVAVKAMFCPVVPEVGLAVSVVVLDGSVEPGHENTVIEKGGSEYGVAGLKLLTLVCVGLTTGVSEVRFSLLSVMLVDVSWLMSTSPVGALAPEKVTGSDPLRLRFITTTLWCVPSVKANDCR